MGYGLWYPDCLLGHSALVLPPSFRECEWPWLYAAIDPETKLILDVQLFNRHGTDPVAAFPYSVTEKPDCSAPVFLVDQYGYRTALAIGLSGQVSYTDRNLIESGFIPSRYG